MNVKELKKFLKDIDDDVEIVVFDESNTLEVKNIIDIQINNDDDYSEILIII